MALPLVPLLLDDRVVAVGKQLFLHCRSLHAVGKGADLNVQQLVLRLIAHHDSITTLTQSRDQHICILGAGDGRNLYHRLPGSA